jgi:hypothetical protein
VKARPFPVLLGLLLVAVVTVLAVGQLGIVGGASGSAPSPSAGVQASPPGSAASPATGASPAPSASDGLTASRSASPAPATRGPITDVPIVPVTNFRAAPTATTHAELQDVVAGKSTRYTALELVAGEADAILAALKADRPSDPAPLTLAPDEAALAADLTKNGKTLAFLRADEVT